MLGLAIVDDVGAIVIITAVYSAGETFGWLAAAVVGIVATVLVRRGVAHATGVYLVILGLLLGKPLGIVLATRSSIRAGLADIPAGTAARQLLGVGLTAGIGFTVALFITELALINPADQANAKLGILAASVLAAVTSLVFLVGARSSSPEPGAS